MAATALIAMSIALYYPVPQSAMPQSAMPQSAMRAAAPCMSEGSLLKRGLLGALGKAEDLMGLKEWKNEYEEERVLNLVAEAESIRQEAKRIKAMRSLPAEEARGGVAPEEESFEWESFVPQAQEAAREKEEKKKYFDEKKKARVELTEGVKTTAANALKAAGGAAAAAVLSATAKAAEAAADATTQPARLSSDEPAEHMAAPPRRAAIADAAGVAAGATAGAARGVASWASRMRDAAAGRAEAEAQWLRLARFHDDLELLGLPTERAQTGGLITERRLRQAWKERSRVNHPDVAAKGISESNQIYAINAAYERLRPVVHRRA